MFPLKKIHLHFFIVIFTLFFVLSCHQKKDDAIYLIVGKSANNVELSTAEDLKKDLEKTIGKQIKIYITNHQEELNKTGVFFVLGTTESNAVIHDLSAQQKINLTKNKPGARGGIWSKIKYENNQEVIVLAGSDVQGFQYAVYDYSKEILGIDPLEYWTGKLPGLKTIKELYNFKSKTIAPPKVPVLAYFENDVDELANYRGKLLEYDWETYTELINSLVRLRYNAIQLFDMLGRPEFFIRPEYKKLKPDYQVDVSFIDKMIDYAHKKGMKIAIDYVLGYQIHPMSVDKADCWKTYKEDWIKAWRYYLEKTPLSKTDIFILRPRHQVWDWEYKSTCGESKIEVFNEVYVDFGKLIDEYKPNAQKVLVCYSDGMEMWNEGFRPPRDWTVVWSDHGFGEFEHLPNTTDGYEFGTYMHAGYWSNHTVHNPYPNKVETVVKEMFKNYDADKICLVNGQTFRPFLLNLEAYSAVCNDPEKFNGDDFYQSWTERYFSKEAAKYAVSSMQWLHKAQMGRKGYVEHLWEIREAISYLSNSPIKRPGKTPIPHDYKRVENDLENTAKCKISLEKSLEEAKKGYERIDENKHFYHSYILLPVELYSDLIAFETTLHKMAVLKKEFEETSDHKKISEAKSLLKTAKEQLSLVYKNRASGDLNKKWKNWYSIKNRRQNNGFPTMQMLEEIEGNLNKITK